MCSSGFKFVTPRAGAENRSAADDVHGGVRAHDELVAVRHGKRLLQANLRERAAFGVQGPEAVHEQDAPRTSRVPWAT